MLKKIIKSVEKISSSFQENELAYLSLTSKIEHLMRDRTAFVLCQLLENFYVVSREYKRIDLVILEKDKKDFNPIIAVQFKAYYTFDFQTKEGAEKFNKLIQEDFEKSQEKCPGSQYFSILFCVHPTSRVDNYPEKIINYKKGINRAFSNKTEKEILEKAEKVINGFDFIVEKTGIIKGGSAFDVKVNVFYWVLRKDN